MQPREIKSKLVLFEVLQAQIARDLGVSKQFVNQVISGRNKKPRAQSKTTSVRETVAKAIKKTVSEVWPEAA